MEVDFVVVLDVEIDNIQVGDYIHVLVESDSEYHGFWYNNCGNYYITVAKVNCHKVDKDPDTLFYRAMPYVKH